MIRTRDFLLYMLVLLFLLSGIAFTIARDASVGSENTLAAQVRFLLTDDVPLEVAESTGVVNREANLASLREKIAAGEGIISEGPPVLDSLDASSEDQPESENPDVPLEETERNERYCSVQTPFAAIAAAWPQSGAELTLVEGARLVQVPQTETIVTGSTTVSTTTIHVVLQLPLVYSRSMSSQCLDSDIVGVARDGSLIRNDEAWRFRSTPGEVVLGYARDGFPIYGQGVDESLLDSCGGYDSGSGYRYHLRENELFVLGCFAGEPQQFIE